MEISQGLIELGVRPFNSANKLVGFHLVRNRERSPCRGKGFKVLRIFRVFRPLPRPKGRIVQRNHLGCRPSEDLRPPVARFRWGKLIRSSGHH